MKMGIFYLEPILPMCCLFSHLRRLLFNYSSNLIDRLNFLQKQKCVGGVYVWMTPFGFYAHQNPIDHQLGYRASMGGFAAGVDGALNDHFFAGFTLGYSTTHLRWIGSPDHGQIQSGYGGAYVRAVRERLFVDGSVVASFDQRYAKRAIFAQSIAGTIARRASACLDGYSCNTHLGIGVDLWHALTQIRLTGSVDWIALHQNTIQERGALSLNLHVESKEASLLRSVGGVVISRCMFNWKAQIGLLAGYDNQLSGAGFRSHFEDYPGEFSTYGLSPARFVALPEVKISSTFFESKLLISGLYQASLSKDYYDNSISFNLSYNF